MVLLQILFAFLLAAAADVPGGSALDGIEALRAEILRMEADDQEAIAQSDAAPDDIELARATDEVLRRNTLRLKEIVAIYSWPTKSLVGEEVSRAAFVIAQHSDHDREFQREMLQLFEPLVGQGEVPASHYAYLWDRTHDPQRYGTQGGCVGRGIWAPRAIEDPEGIDERRAAVGLKSMSFYVALAGTLVCGEWTPEPEGVRAPGPKE
jgi:hypothetical protein